MHLLLWSLVISPVHLFLYGVHLHCKLCYITREHYSSHGIGCDVPQCTKLADDT